MFQIGPHIISTPIILAPMAGITDKPFRAICRQFGAGLTPSEMIGSQPQLWHTEKSRKRRDHIGEPGPITIQISGTDPQIMALSAKKNVDHGAQIIDINMGCPAKKVCKKAAGSALLANESLVGSILESVVNAVNVPVTLKIRTGTNPEHRNGVHIAKIAQDAGIQALTVHGRTKACAFRGNVEYDTIALIKQQVNIPVIANGDITTPQKAKYVLDYTGADAIMIGRAAQGQPWIFRDIKHFLHSNQMPSKLPIEEKHRAILNHVSNIHQFYGEILGVRMARKHVKWYLKYWPEQQNFLQQFMQLENSISQQNALIDLFQRTW